ncbi:MAG: hypothetical protein H0U70_07235 [Tatlockia sp.]|nr:hypothetical protein [Tatlockia sp.]MBA3978640.1 hypothetical protein [Nitrosopumilus sp.]
MSPSLVERTDIFILHNLKSNSVHFSDTAQAVIERKENRSIGFLLPIGIMLNKFTDFINESLLQLDEVQENIKNFKDL